MHVQGAFEPTPRKRKVTGRVYKEHDAAFAAILHEAQGRLARMHVALRDRSIRLCGANNSRRRVVMDLPNALDAPERYVWRAYEFGSHNFDFLRAMYRESGGECGVVGVDSRALAGLGNLLESGARASRESLT